MLEVTDRVDARQLLAAHDRSRVELAEFREELLRRSGS